MSELEMKIEALIRCVPEDAWSKALEEVSEKNNTVSEKKDIVTKNLEDVIHEALRDIGMPCHIKGYEYSASAIAAIYEDHELIHCIVKGLYTEVAKKHNSTISRVERSIRHGIECAWDRYGTELREKRFCSTMNIAKDKPVVSEFLATMVEIVKERMR